jgi:hypothetical protein
MYPMGSKSTGGAMAIHQKRRSLYSGIPAGLNFIEGKEVGLLPVSEVPFELEKTIMKWILTLPEIRDDRNPTTAIMHDDPNYGLCLTEIGWSGFVTWMLDALLKEEAKPDFVENARRLFYKNKDQLFD